MVYRRDLSDEAQGYDAETRPGTDHSGAAASVAERWAIPQAQTLITASETSHTFSHIAARLG